LAFAILLAAPALAGVPIDGHLDSAYGPALVTQTTQTSTNDNPCGFGGANSLSESAGSELDAVHGFVSEGVLYLFLAGNVMSYLGEFQHQDQLHVFIDSRPGGQNALRGDNADNNLNTLAGLTFDAGFTPDYWFNCNVAGPVSAYFAELLDGGGGMGYFLGHGTAGGPGDLSGGTNPDGVMVTIDDRNCGGVTSGCQAASGAGVTSGIEWAIPLAAIGSPSVAIRVCAIAGGLMGIGGNSDLSNQVLGPVPPGTCALGNPATVNFEAIPGAQWFTIDTSTASAPRVDPTQLAFALAGPNPVEGDALFVIELPAASRVCLRIEDVRGRRMATLLDEVRPAGSSHVTWPASARDGVAPGAYFASLRVGSRMIARKLVVLR
jgi:hypothetical protein